MIEENSNGDNVAKSPNAPAIVWGVLFFIALAAAVVFLVLWLMQRSDEEAATNAINQKLTLVGPRIKGNATSITGGWESTGPTNEVALYASEKPFQYDTDGTIKIITGEVFFTSNTAMSNENNGNTINITDVLPNRSYNAAMVVSNEKTVSTITFGPIKVFTQDSSFLETGKLFNIRDLDNCTGQVSTTGSYTTKSGNAGIYRLGSNMNTGMNEQGKQFLVRYTANDAESITEPTEILCRRSETSSDVVLGIWANSLANVGPIICPPGDTISDNTCSSGATPIIPSLCNWDYNLTPATAQGQNKWCLTSSQTVNMVTNETNYLCLSGSGEALSVSSVESAGRWYNECTGMSAN